VGVLPDTGALRALPRARVPEQGLIFALAKFVLLKSRSGWASPAGVADFILDERKRAVAAIDVLGGVGRTLDAGFCLGVSVPIVSPLASRCAVTTDAGLVLCVNVLSSWAQGTGVGRRVPELPGGARLDGAGLVEALDEAVRSAAADQLRADVAVAAIVKEAQDFVAAAVSKKFIHHNFDSFLKRRSSSVGQKVLRSYGQQSAHHRQRELHGCCFS